MAAATHRWRGPQLAGLHETEYGEVHKRFHAVMDEYSTNPIVWEKAASDLWLGLQRAIKNEAALKASGTLPPRARTLAATELSGTF